MTARDDSRSEGTPPRQSPKSPLPLGEDLGEGVTANFAAHYRGGAQTVSLLQHARRLRRDSTDAERVLWNLLRSRQMLGAKFRRQHQFGPYILDFFCPEERLAVEADGGQHWSKERAAVDAERTRHLERHGVRVLRFTNREILLETEAVRQAIAQALTLPSP